VPELPDLELYVEHLKRRVVGQRLERVRVAGWNLLRTTEPPLEAAAGRLVRGVRRMGKRLVFELERGLFLALHLMISGRLHWRAAGIAIPKRVGLAAFDFAGGSLLLTEASTKQRAALHLLADAASLRSLDGGGIEPLSMSTEALAECYQRRPHAQARPHRPAAVRGHRQLALGRDPPPRPAVAVRRTSQLTRTNARGQRRSWACSRSGGTGCRRDRRRFPEKVTAFRPGMAVHGRYRQPCPDCGAPVQRVVYAENEMNYCARCQTAGRLLADRALSRLLHDDWPRTLEELEERRRERS
jgi:formamidopyrimidine-DNA glycosylase